MPYTLQWKIEGAVVQVIWEQEVTIDDLVRLNTQLPELIETQNRPTLHVLYDYDQINRLPDHVSDIVNKSRPNLTHPRIGWMVGYNVRNPILEITLNVVTKAYTRKYHIAANEQDALDFLQSVDPHLDFGR